MKAFDAIRWTSLRDKGQPHGDGIKTGIPFSGDDPRAKETVARLSVI